MHHPVDLSWNALKKEVYFEVSGQLRDIYIQNTSIEDWQKWTDFVNENYSVKFAIYGNEEQDKIDFEYVKCFLADKDLEGAYAKIRLGNIQVMCYFFGEDEIENDIAPEEFNSMEDHFILIDYLTKISQLLVKQVKVAEERCSEEIVLMIVDGVKIYYPLYKVT